MNTPLLYLTYVAAFTGLLWLPYVLQRILSWGLIDAVGYPSNPKPQAPWAQRMMKAHANAVENLVVFGCLVLVAQFSGLAASSSTIATACGIYFWARVVHALAYTLGIPWVRTLSFATGFFCQAAIALQLLGR
ncbi:MAG: MAPEG family protein [Burkholderiaceae bacterium]|nr:MAPEG family protein [Burkholderiaceae bacterium]